MSRALVLCAALACACGADVARPNVARGRGAGATRTRPDAGVHAKPDAGAARDAGDGASLDERSLAPGMREVLRKQLDVAPSTTLSVPTSAQVDTCARVAVRTLGRVRARLVGPWGVLGEGPVLPERGPACVRKGQTLTVELTSESPAQALVVVWVSP